MQAIFAAILFSLSQLASAAVIGPNPAFTPGALCTSSSPDFKNYDYPEHIARCNRAILLPEKQAVAKNYGNIPEANWPDYEFDHLIPLCAGGANDEKNLWPQPIAEAHRKDQLEDQICVAMKAGTLTQAQALQKVHDWFQQQLPTILGLEISSASSRESVSCQTDPGQSRELGSQVQVTFDRSKRGEIAALHVSLLVNGAASEILSSGEAEIYGTPAKAVSGPLQGLLRYSIKTKNDRFYLYLPDASLGAVDSFMGFFKASFEDSYPELNRLACGFVNH